MTNTYSDYSNKVRSSKIILCHADASQRLSVFTLDSGTIYTKAVSYFVVDIKEDGTSLVNASSASLNTGEWYYNPVTGDLYVNTTDDTDPKTHTIIVTYRMFFSNRAIDLPFDLSSGSEVHYDGRIMSNSPIRKELDEEQIGVMLETSTNISFHNNDGYFDDFYDTLIWENKSLSIYSWSEILPLSEKKKIFDGIIQNKTFSNTAVKFSCKDFTHSLREPITAINFTANDGNVPEKYLNTPKRRLFGRFKQLRCTPISSILNGFTLTGTVVGNSGSTAITGTGTSFLSELSPSDEIIYTTANETKKYAILSIESDTALTLSDELDLSLGSVSVIIKPVRPYRLKNRRWHIAGHKLRAPSTTVTSATQANRLAVASSSDLEAGDLITVDGENAFIKRVSGLDIVLTANLQAGTPSASDVVAKNPLSKAFINGSEVFIDRDWSVSNGTSDAVLVLNDLAEFNVAPVSNIGFDLVFTGSSREITVSGVDMQTELQTRDWIRSDDISHTTWYEVLNVSYDNDTTTSTITIRVAYAGGTTTTNAQKKNITLIDDEAIITVNCLGQERSNLWVKTASDAVKDLLENDAGLTNINTSSFTESDADAPFELSYAIPSVIGGRIKPIKDVISDINRSVFGSLTIDTDFNLKYQVLTPEKPTDLTELKDHDLVSDISINSRNEIVRKVNAKYLPFSDRFTGEVAFELYEFTNEFVDDLVGAKSEMDITLHLFELDHATTIAQRYALYNSLSQSTLTIKGKLNLGLKSLNDKIWINLDRLYKRLGNNDRRKIGIINKVSNNGADVTLEINDLGNAFNRTGNISDDASLDFTSAPDSEKVLYSYIVDAETETPDITSDAELFANQIG